MKTHRYTWEGIDQSGKRLYGIDSAFSSKAMAAQLEDNHILPLKIKRQPFTRELFKKIPQKHIHDFTRQLTILTQAGISLSQALFIIANTFQKKAMHRVETY